MKRTWLAAGFAATLLTLSVPSTATIVTWRASGTIEEVLEFYGVLPFAVTIGDPFSFQFSFDTQTPDSNPFDPSFGQYDRPTAPSSVVMQIGSGIITFDVATDLAAINVLNNVPLVFGEPGERDGFSAGATRQLADLSEYGAEIALYDDRNYLPDFSGTVGGEGPLSSDELPSEVLDLARFASVRQFFFSSFVTGIGTDAVFGRIDSLVDVTPVRVDEPGLPALLWTGVLALILLARRRGLNAAR